MTVAWLLPGAWCAAVVLSHGVEVGGHEFELALSGTAGDTSCGHDHSHSHDKAPPVLSTEGAKKLDASILLTAAVHIEGPAEARYSHNGTALGHAARHAASDSSPRAPPIA